MMRKLAITVCLLSAILFIRSTAYSQLRSLETENLHLIYYSKAHEYLVPHIARCFENALHFHCNLFQYSPSEKITILMQDFRDFGHGGAETVPQDFINIGIEPFSYDYETIPANERMNWMMNHELVHIVTLDQPSGSDHFFRSIFLGKVAPNQTHPISIMYGYLTNPRRFTPRWYMEGIAVFLETWMAGGLGRAMGAYDEMVFRTLVRDRCHIYDMIGLEAEGTAIDFQVGVNSYLYGTRFMSYLANKYSPQKLIEWLSRCDGSKAYFTSQFKKIYGCDLDDEWEKWIQWEHQWQEDNLQLIRSNPTTPFRSISKHALGSVSRSHYDPSRQKLYAAVNYPGQVAHIAAIDIKMGEIDKICNVKGPALYFVTSLAYDPASDQLFYTTDNNGWRDLNVIDLQTKQSKTLLKDVRTGDIVFNPADQSIWGVRHYIGISTLVKIPHPYEEWNQIYSFPYGEDIFDIDISPDGSTVTAAHVDVSGNHQLIAMDIQALLDGYQSYDVLFDFENSVPADFTYSSDGHYLFGSSYFSGVSNIYRYDVQKQDMAIMTNCETGFFRPVPFSEDSLIVMRYAGKGFHPAVIPIQPPEHVRAINFLGNQIAENYPVVKSWKLSSPTSIDIDSMTVSKKEYHTLNNLHLVSAYPVVEGYKDFTAVGMRFEFLDKTRLSAFDVTASYSPTENLSDSEKLHLGFNFRHWSWKLHGSYNGADFYDLFGPTKTSRKGYSLGIQYRKTLFYDEPKNLNFTFHLTGYGNLEKLPQFQNVVAPYDQLINTTLMLNYEYQRASLGAVTYEKGMKWGIISHTNYVNGTFYPRLFGNVDIGFALPIHHTSFWLRNSAGYSFGDRSDPFANFYFGGFGNNWIDHLSIRRYREPYSFPGVEINAIGGNNYGKMTAELILPPIRFRRFGIPVIYFNWMRVSLFSTGIVTDIDKEDDRRSLFNLGGQLDIRLVLFSNLSSTFSLGYAAAFEENQRISNEFMISLKIL